MSSTTTQPTAEARRHTVEIIVNNQAVQVEDKRLTGLEIKEAAIAQGVPIQLDFQLSLHHPNGEVDIIGGTDEVKVHPHAEFTAVAGDDNS